MIKKQNANKYFLCFQRQLCEDHHLYIEYNTVWNHIKS